MLHPTKSKQNLRVFWKLLNLQDCVWENHYHIIMKIILQEKIVINYSIIIWFTNIFLSLKPYKIPAAKAAVDKEWKKLWENSGVGTWQKSEARKRWSMKQRRRAQKFILHHWWTYVIWKNAELGAKHQKYKGRVVLQGDIVKGDSGSYAAFTEQGSSVSQMTAAKVMDIISRLPGCDGQAADAASAWNPGQTGRCSQNIGNSKIGMSRQLDSSTPTQWPKSWSSMEDPVVSLERNLYGHPLARLLWERQFEKILCKARLGESFKLGMSCSLHRQKGLFLSVYVDDIKIGWKETKHWSDVENTQQRCRFGRTIIFPWSCLLRMHSKTMWNK